MRGTPAGDTARQAELRQKERPSMRLHRQAGRGPMCPPSSRLRAAPARDRPRRLAAAPTHPPRRLAAGPPSCAAAARGSQTAQARRAGGGGGSGEGGWVAARAGQAPRAAAQGPGRQRRAGQAPGQGGAGRSPRVPGLQPGAPPPASGPPPPACHHHQQHPPPLRGGSKEAGGGEGVSRSVQGYSGSRAQQGSAEQPCRERYGYAGSRGHLPPPPHTHTRTQRCAHSPGVVPSGCRNTLTGHGALRLPEHTHRAWCPPAAGTRAGS
jgi:hypothetical protein